jgi:RHS repeat-associated protein
MAFHKGLSGNAALTNRYLWGPEVDQLLSDEQVTSLSSAGTTYFALTDNLGSVRDLVTYNSGTDTTTVAKHRAFDSFGNVTTDSASGVVEMFSYTAKMVDPFTGKLWYWQRWFDPILATWMSPDLGGFGMGSMNLQEYVGNHPSYATDPSGLMATSPSGVIHAKAVTIGLGMCPTLDILQQPTDLYFVDFTLFDLFKNSRFGLHYNYAHEKPETFMWQYYSDPKGMWEPGEEKDDLGMFLDPRFYRAPAWFPEDPPPDPRWRLPFPHQSHPQPPTQILPPDIGTPYERWGRPVAPGTRPPNGWIDPPASELDPNGSFFQEPGQSPALPFIIPRRSRR